MAVRFSDGGDAYTFISSSFLCYFIVWNCYIYILRVYMFIIVYIYLHLLPRTPDCVMAEARIPENFGDTQIRVRILDFVGLGLRMPREAWRLPSPQTLQNKQKCEVGR